MAKFKEAVKSLIHRNYLVALVLERLNFYRRIEMAPHIRNRRELAHRFLHGQGVEIGALHIRLKVPRGVQVRYVDFIDHHEARRRYSELRFNKLTKVDIVDDGEVLSKIAPNSIDFVIANHMIEHCENPLGTIENWLSKLRVGGTVFLTVPDMRYTFDRDRTPTTTEHLLRDYEEGPQGSLEGHYREWVRAVSKVPAADVEAAVSKKLEAHENIHFHAWRPVDFLDAIIHCQQHLNWPIELAAFQTNGEEFLVVLTRT